MKGQKLDWEAISQNPKLDASVLWNYKDNLNWKLVTKNKIDCSNLQQLEKYQEYIDWRFVSDSDKFELSNINLNKFKQYLDWHTINNRTDFVINNDILNYFCDVIDWNKASESREIVFTEELIEQYRSKWNWQILKQNPSVVENLNSVLKKYKAEINCVTFLERFHQKPYIYHFTHLFNAMTPLTHRAPGVVGAALNGDVSVELIVDTVHVDPSLYNMLWKLKGRKLCFITDCLPAGGLLVGEYTLGGQKIIYDGTICTLEDGTIAGSVLHINKGVWNVYTNSDIPLYECVNCASLNPAAVIGMEKTKGSLETGKDADIIITDSDFEVQKTIIAGEIKYEA